MEVIFRQVFIAGTDQQVPIASDKPSSQCFAQVIIALQLHPFQHLLSHLDSPWSDRQIQPMLITLEDGGKHILYTEVFNEHRFAEFGMKVFIELETDPNERLVLVTDEEDILSGYLVGQFHTVAIHLA